METGFTIATVLLVLFSLLAISDGLYLHLIKYRLYGHEESKFEHLTHTIRALLFPAILYFLFLSQNATTFYFGLVVVLLDVLTLVIDAYVEKDSRQFMGGLPRWEYIIHLMVNGFHFASIAVFLVLKLQLEGSEIIIRNDLNGLRGYNNFSWLVETLIPGGIILGLLHLMLIFKKPAALWNKIISKRPIKIINKPA